MQEFPYQSSPKRKVDINVLNLKQQGQIET